MNELVGGSVDVELLGNGVRMENMNSNDASESNVGLCIRLGLLLKLYSKLSSDVGDVQENRVCLQRGLCEEVVLGLSG
jgi:hypothetical protein